MSDEKTEKAGLTISVKIPREKIELPAWLKCGRIAFAIFAVLLMVLLFVAIFFTREEITLSVGSWTLKSLSYHPMLVLMLCLGFAFILLLLYFVYCRYVLGIARENRKAEKYRMDFISQQVDVLKNLAVAPDKRQRTETIKVIIEHLAKSGDGGAGTAEKGPEGPNGGGDDGSLPYQSTTTSPSLSSCLFRLEE